METQIENRVKRVAAAGSNRAARSGNGHNFAAGVFVRRHGQRRVTAGGRLAAKGERVGFVRAQRHVDPAPFQPVAVSETGVRRTERNHQRRRAATDRIKAQVIRWCGRRCAVTTAVVKPRRLDGQGREVQCVGSGGEGLPHGRIVVGVIIYPVGRGLVALGRKLGNVVRPRRGRDRPDVRERLRA